MYSINMFRMTSMPAERIGRISKYRRPSPKLVVPVAKILHEKALFMCDFYDELLWGLATCSGSGGDEPHDRGKDVRYHGDHEREVDGQEQDENEDISSVVVELEDLVSIPGLDTDTDQRGELDRLAQTYGDADINASTTTANVTGEVEDQTALFGGVPVDRQGMSQFSVCHLGIPREWIGDEDISSSPSQPTIDADPVQETSDISVTQDISNTNDVPELTDDGVNLVEEAEDAYMADFANCALRRFHAAFSETSSRDDDEQEWEQDLESFLASKDVDPAFFSSSMLSSLMDQQQPPPPEQDTASGSLRHL